MSEPKTSEVASEPNMSAVSAAMSEPKIFIASDHRGFDEKLELLEHLRSETGVYIGDLGPARIDPDDDFNDAAISVCKAVLKDPENSRGILICGSAHGIAIQSNRFKGIRAIAAYTPELAKIGREHEDANVLCLSADFVEPDTNLEILKTFLETAALADERYRRRERRLDEEVD